MIGLFFLIFICAFAVSPLIICGLSEYYEHVERMEQIKQQAERTRTDRDG